MTSKLTVQQAYGLNSFTKNTISVLDDHSIIYVCGNQIIILNIETKDQVFLNVAPNASGNNTTSQINGISALAVSFSKKFIAVAEKGDSFSIPPSIAFYDLVTHKKKRVLNFPESNAQSDIISMAFCNDGHLFITQSKYPDGTLTLWNIDNKTNRIVATSKSIIAEDITVNQIAFCPYDPNIVLVTGKGILKLYRIVDNQLRPATFNIRMREIINYTTHCWLNADTMILGSEEGEIFLVENFEYRGVIYPAEVPIGTMGAGAPNALSAASIKSSTPQAAFASVSTRGSTAGQNKESSISIENSEKGLPVYSLVANSKGGFISGHNDGEIILFEKHLAASTAHHNMTGTNFNSASAYQIEKRIQLPTDKKGAIHSLNIINEENLILSTDTHQLLNFNLSSLDQSKDNQVFDPLLTLFHQPSLDSGDSSIVSIGTCLWKPNIVFTCGKDSTLKLWNVLEKKLELSCLLEDEPNFMAVHPTGIYVAIASDPKISIYTILKDSISLVGQLPVRSCTALAYSNGGQFISAASGSTIHIFDSVTASPVSALRGHANRIKNVVWQEFDATLLSFGYEGSILVWDIIPGEKRPEGYNCSVSTLAGVGTKDGSYAFCTNFDHQFKKITFSKGANPNASQNNNAQTEPANTSTALGLLGGTKKDALNAYVTAIATLDLKRDANVMLIDEMHGILIIGAGVSVNTGERPGSTIANNGVPNTQVAVSLDSFISSSLEAPGENIKKSNVGAIIRIPINFDTVPNYAPDISTIHGSNITALCLSPDGNYLYSADETGCWFVSKYEIITAADSSNKTNLLGASVAAAIKPAGNSDNNANFQFSEEVIILNSDIEKANKEINKLNTEIAEVINSNTSKTKHREIENEKAINKLNQKFQSSILEENAQVQIIVDNKTKLMKGLNDEIRSFEQQAAEEIEKVEKKYQYKLNTENTRLENLKNEMETLEKKWKDESHKLIESHETYIEDIVSENESQIQEEMELKAELFEAKGKQTNTSKERGLLIKSDVDNEIAQIKISYENKIKFEENIVAELLLKHGNTKKDLAATTAELEQHKEEVVRMKEKESRLIENIKTLEKDIQQQKKDIREREDSITDKDKRMVELKKKNQELEKFRFVLDYKIKELKLQIAPSEQEIFSMRKQLEEMNTELTQYKKSSQALTVMTNELKLKMNGLKHEVDNENDKINQNNRIIESIHRDLKHLDDTLQKGEDMDANALKQIIIGLFRDYVQSVNDAKESTSGMSNTKVLIDPEKTYNRDREQMERNVVSLTRLVGSGTAAYKRDVKRKVQDNQELQAELELLKKDQLLIQKQKDYIDQMIQEHGGEKLPPEDLQQLLFLLGLDRSTKQAGKNAGRLSLSSSSSQNSLFSTSQTSQSRRSVSQNPGGEKVENTGFLPDIHSKTIPNTPERGNRNDSNNRVNTTDKDPKLSSNNDNSFDFYETWEEIEEQTKIMKNLETEITKLCLVLQMNPQALINEIDSRLVLG